MNALLSFIIAIAIAAFLIWWLNGKNFNVDGASKPAPAPKPQPSVSTQASTAPGSTSSASNLKAKKHLAPPHYSESESDTKHSTVRKRAAHRQKW